MSTSIHGLVAALEDATQAHHTRCAEFAKQAEEIEYPQAAKLFRAMIAAEKARLKLYCRSLTAMESHQEDGYDYYICPQCGYASGDDVPDKCPVCEAGGYEFEMIN